MKFADYRKLNSNRGQSLLELIIAIGIFVVTVSALAFLVLGSYIPGRLAKELTEADYLAEEGIEAARSIRDNSWDSLSPGSHGLDILNNHWVFQGTQEDIGWQLSNGIRVVKVEDIDPDRRKVISQVDWLFAGNRHQQIRLITYLTNWQKITVYCEGTCTSCDNFTTSLTCRNQDGCSWVARDKICTGSCTACDNFLDQASCEDQSGCIWTGP